MMLKCIIQSKLKGFFFLFTLFLMVMILSVCNRSQTLDTLLDDETGARLILDSEDSNITLNDGKIIISWNADRKVDYYDISRAGSRLGKYSPLGRSAKSSFTDNSPNSDKYENYYKVTAFKNTEILYILMISFELKMFGANMRFYDIEYDSMTDIQNEVNRIHDNEMHGSVVDSHGRTGEFSSKRYAMYFKPGEYPEFEALKAGFYTHLGGLGALPSQTRLNGSIETPPHLQNNNATCTFWRSIENLEINGGRFRWGVSQAAPVRRMNVTVPAQFDWNSGWASGGYSADSRFSDETGSWSQQQWYARNSHFAEGFYGVNWNKVTQGCAGKIENDNWESKGCVTKIDTTPVIREKPFLYLEDGGYKVFVPALRKDASGVSWRDTNRGAGLTLDIEKDFYIAKAGRDTSDTINAALDSGRHIFLTPGRYELKNPVHVKRAGTVVLGTGYATLIPAPENKHGALFVDDVDNVTVASLLFDALYRSTYLLCMGGAGSDRDHAASPSLLADVFLRVGGYSENAVHADIAAIINSNDVIGDHFWVWRADHGKGVGWDKNTSKNGVLVTGDRVTVYGLFVEHFHEYQTVWLGDNGRMFFYQCELPYDPFYQSVYRSHNGAVDGWSAYKVGNDVNNHFAAGLGIYAVFNRTGPDRKKSESMFLQNAVEVPEKPGVTVKHACVVELSGRNTETVKTGIRSIVNGTGPGVGGEFAREYIVSYNNGNVTANSGSRTSIKPSDEVFYIPEKLLP